MRDEELRKAEQLSTKNDMFEILHHSNAYWQTVYVYASSIRYAVGFEHQLEKGQASIELIKLFKNRLPTACLVD